MSYHGSDPNITAMEHARIHQGGVSLAVILGGLGKTNDQAIELAFGFLDGVTGLDLRDCVVHEWENTARVQERLSAIQRQVKQEESENNGQTQDANNGDGRIHE